jgi:PAS domain-containing protein
MTESIRLRAILDSLDDPILFADTDHVVRYMNRAGIAHYEGGRSLLGSSLLECHNENSQKVIREVLVALQAGEDERHIFDTEEHRVYMRAVRSSGGQLLGYYERYEPRAG